MARKSELIADYWVTVSFWSFYTFIIQAQLHHCHTINAWLALQISQCLLSLPLPLITVISELEGLSRGIKPLTSASGIIVSGGNTATTTPTAVNSSRTIGNRSDPQHAAFVAKASKEALEFLKSTNSAVKYEKKLTRFHRKPFLLKIGIIFRIRSCRCVTARGSVLANLNFTNEDSSTEFKSNDDIILATALSLCNKCTIEERKEGEKRASKTSSRFNQKFVIIAHNMLLMIGGIYLHLFYKNSLTDFISLFCSTGEVRYLVREVVLLTTDRNLRVKALTNDIPVRELSDFIKWAGLGSLQNL